MWLKTELIRSFSWTVRWCCC